MSNTLHSHAQLSPLAASVGLAIALIVLFAVCAVVQAVAPDLTATHAWIGLFTAAPPLSMRSWAEGLLFSALFGALAGAVFVAGYNVVVRKIA